MVGVKLLTTGLAFGAIDWQEEKKKITALNESHYTAFQCLLNTLVVINM